jgi:hypothetical protein
MMEFESVTTNLLDFFDVTYPSDVNAFKTLDSSLAIHRLGVSLGNKHVKGNFSTF